MRGGASPLRSTASAAAATARPCHDGNPTEPPSAGDDAQPPRTVARNTPHPRGDPSTAAVLATATRAARGETPRISLFFLFSGRGRRLLMPCGVCPSCVFYPAAAGALEHSTGSIMSKQSKKQQGEAQMENEISFCKSAILCRFVNILRRTPHS